MNIIKKYILRPIVHYPILYFKNKNIPSNPSYATFDASVQDELKRMINKRAALPSVSAIYRIKNGEIFIRISILAIAPLCKEIICVDNGSTDNTIQILEQLQSELAGICEIKIYHYNKNVHLAGVDYKKRILSDKGGNSSTLAEYYNYAFSKATSEYVVKVDSHYLFMPKGIDYIQKKLAANPRVLYFRSAEIYGESRGYEPFIYKNDRHFSFVDKDLYEAVQFDYNPTIIERILNRIYSPVFIHIKRLSFIKHINDSNPVAKLYNIK